MNVKITITCILYIKEMTIIKKKEKIMIEKNKTLNLNGMPFVDQCWTSVSLIICLAFIVLTCINDSLPLNF
jgi:hypothetical protein